MKVFKVIVLLGLLVLGCGREDDKEIQAIFDINLVSLDPIPGDYPYKPIIRIKKIDDGTGLGRFKVKTSKISGFIEAVDCVKFFGPRDADYDCITPGREALEYFFESPKSKSATASVTYNLKANKRPYEVHSRQDKGGKAEKLPMDEVKTYCRFNPDDDSTWVFIQSATPKLAGKWVYTIFPLKKVSAGDTVKFDSASGAVAGVQIQNAGDLDPTDFSPGKNYRTGLAPGAEGGGQGEEENGPAAGGCEAKVGDINPGKTTLGTIECRGLPHVDTAKEGEKPQPTLGKYIDFSANWQCDGYN